jgi:hypothetical protein
MRDRAAPLKCKRATKVRRADIFCGVFVAALRKTVKEFSGREYPAVIEAFIGKNYRKRPVKVILSLMKGAASVSGVMWQSLIKGCPSLNRNVHPPCRVMMRKTESMQPKTIFAVLLFLAATCCGAESVEDIRTEEILQPSAGEITREGEKFVYHKVLEGYILRYDAKEKRLAIVSRETPTRVQELGNIESYEDAIPIFYSIDINMDGFADIAYRTDCGYNCASAYLVFDPESARFIPNAVDLFVQDIAFDADARIFTAYQAGGMGYWVASVYAPDGQHFPVLQKYSHSWLDDEYLENEESAYSRFKLAEDFEAVGASARFALRVEIDYQYPDDRSDGENSVGAVVRQGRKTELFFIHAEIRERQADDSPKSARYSFVERENGKRVGEYSFTRENGEIVEARYIRWMDRQIFDLTRKTQNR